MHPVRARDFPQSRDVQSRDVQSRDAHPARRPTGRPEPVLAALRDLRDLRELREIAHDGPAGPPGLGDHGRLLPVPAALAGLLPRRALARGTTVAVEGSAALLLAVLAEPSRAGAWCAVVGYPALGLLAAAEAGIALDRLVLVPEPGPRWPVVTAALIDALDVVAVRPPAGERTAGSARRLAARARERGCLLLPVGAGWEGAELRLTAAERSFHGLGQGHGHLRGARLLVQVSGRGAASRTRHGWLTVAGHDPVIELDDAAGLSPATGRENVIGQDLEADAAVAGLTVAGLDGAAGPRVGAEPGASVARGLRVVEGAA
ncbi:hypothetical protein [Pseudofrankia sp. DC12]|uniref:hypothetical protein n=1 Tax=Pseudofrankia sp. DC12 TaxID=683315 RepID=UPI0009FF22FF|nr:hypothetical protein [Pseudofrankia sp. DC12]